MKLLVWTGAMMVVSPVAGFLSERYGSRLFMVAGLALQAIALGWMASVASVDMSYASLVGPVRRSPAAAWRSCSRPSANAVLASVRTDADRAGVGRHQRDPRARRRARDRGARHRVHEPRQLPLAAGLRQRPRAGAVGGCGRAGRRRADRGGAAVQHSRLGRRARGGGSRRRPARRSPRSSPTTAA